MKKPGLLLMCLPLLLSSCATARQHKISLGSVAAGSSKSGPKAGSSVRTSHDFGSDPTILQSGKNDGLHYSITRKGNSFLRKYLYLAVGNMAMHKADNAITRFYSKKKSIGLCHKAAATAACRKLLVTIWGMLRSGSFFER